MNPIRSSGYCDNCGRKTILQGVYENPHKPYPTAWYCESCAERFSKGWIGSTELTIIDGSKLIPTVFGGTGSIPSVWIEIEEQDKKEEEKMIICDFCQKEILESQSFIELPTHSSVELPVSYIFIHRDCLDSFVAHIPKAKRVIEKEAFQKEILKYLKVTADMAEANDELAWRIWQVYGRLEDLWSEK